MIDPKDVAWLTELLARSNPFACLQPNPSIVLDTQNSWGRTETIHEAEKVELVRTQLPVMAYVVLVARAIEIDNGTNPTQLYPYARIKYGNGNVLAENLLDVTGGWMESVIGSTFEMEVFLADENMFPPESGSGAYAKFQGWGCVGVTPYPQRNTQFYDSTATAPTAIVTGCDGQPIQGRITDIDGFVVGASSTPSYLIFWDSNLLPTDANFGTPKILHVFLLDPGTSSFEKTYFNTKPFINGVTYALSTSPTSYVAETATALHVTVETARDG
jgi:hypothetical protein